MSIGITVPKLGESIVEATVVRWFKQEGESVAKGEALLELETDKVNLEVNANNNGILVRIECAAGEAVRIGDLLAVLEESADVRVNDPSGPVVEVFEAGEYDRGGPADASGVMTALPDHKEEIPCDRVTPVARRVAEDAGVPITSLIGTGIGGKIRREDVERAIALRKDHAEEETAVEVIEKVRKECEEVLSLPQLGAAITSKTPVAEHGAMLTTFNEIDMSTVIKIRRRSQEALDEGHSVQLRFMPFFVKAVTEGLKDFPALNAEVRGDSVVKKPYSNIGIALDGEGGLVIPVLRDAGNMSFAELESNIMLSATKAGAGTLSPEDQQGGSFTITDVGVFGSMLSTPILNPLQAGVLGLHRIEDRPIATDGKVVIKPIMYVALSYDSRVIDGREAEHFLGRVKSLIEIPTFLLLEV